MWYADSDEDHVQLNDDRDMDHWEAIDMEDYEYCPDPHTLDKLSQFFQTIPNMLEIVEDDIQNAVDKMAIPKQAINIEAIEFDDALREGHVPALNEEAGRLFTGSERLLQNYARAKALTASDVKSLIQDVLRNPDFDPNEVDTDMMERLNRAIEDGDFESIDVWKEGDGGQEVKFYKRNLEKVIRELMADPRLQGCQHFGFKEYKDGAGNRIYGGHANGSISFELAQMRVGSDKVPCPWLKAGSVH